MSKSNSKQLHKRIRTATRAEPEEQPIEEQPTEPRVIEVAPLTVVQNSPNEEAELVFTDEPTFRLRKRKASSLPTTSTIAQCSPSASDIGNPLGKIHRLTLRSIRPSSNS